MWIKLRANMTKLAMLSTALGVGVCVPQLYALAKPEAMMKAARGFPRSVGWGYVLMGLGTAWFLWNLSLESVADFADYKTYMYLGFALAGILTCIYVQDFLAVRGLALVIMLMAKLMLDTARWSQTSWRLVIVIWAYVLVVAGIWLTISPWRLRDLLNWSTTSVERLRFWSALRLGFGLFVLALGLVVF
jgi:hypothetical protein